MTNDEQDRRKSRGAGVGIVFGAGIGSGIGIVLGERLFGDVSYGLVFGAAMGLTLGTNLALIFIKRKDSEESQD